MNNMFEDFTFPELKSERIKRLKVAKEILKSEFIGLDSIIDEIIKDISPWYITPEVIERPVVISLFGMSGTGKTSIVRRLTSLLGLTGKTVSFDCGEESNDSNSMTLADKIVDSFGLSCYDDSSNSSLDNMIREAVFVFDEFQYARTISENGEEIIKPTLRPIWNIIDSGIISITDYKYDTSHFISFLEDFSVFAQEHQDMEISDGEIQKREDVKSILLSLGLFHYDRDIKQLLGGKDTYKEAVDIGDNNEDSDEDILSPLKILDRVCLRAIIKKLNSISKNYGFEKIKELNSYKTLGEFYESLRDLKYIMSTPKTLNCSGALVFIIGNLDEAFHVQSDISPDMDADTFYYQTSSVSISDIKEALKSRFRAEQIARFGNNLIKYPTLKKEDFKKIITKELNRILGKFYETEKIHIKVSQGISDLLYSEGVFPSQGVRPVFSTIGSFFTPFLSDIIVAKHSGKVSEEDIVDLRVEDEEDNISLNQKEITIVISYPTMEDKKIIPLQLGPLRDPSRRATRYCNAVHEAGHAIVFLYENGEFPRNIVAVSSGDGGFCDTYNKKKEGEIDSVEDIDSEIRVCLGGYLAEKLVFGKEPGKCLIGSSSDIDAAWEVFSSAAYRGGYFEPVSFTNFLSSNTPDGIPNGIADDEPKVGGKELNLQEAIQQRFIELINDTNRILSEETRLLREVSLELGNNGSMTKERFEELVWKFGSTITKEFVEEKRKYRSGEWYLDVLKSFE